MQTVSKIDEDIRILENAQQLFSTPSKDIINQISILKKQKQQLQDNEKQNNQQKQDDKTLSKSLQTSTQFEQTGTSFFKVLNPNQYPKLTNHQEAQLLQNSLSCSLESQYQCLLTTQPEKGLITGTVKISRPDKKVEVLNFNLEMGYRAKVDIKKAQSSIYTGYAYYRMACFNPLKTEADSLEVNVQFQPYEQNIQFTYPEFMSQKDFIQNRGYTEATINISNTLLQLSSFVNLAKKLAEIKSLTKIVLNISNCEIEQGALLGFIINPFHINLEILALDLRKTKIDSNTLMDFIQTPRNKNIRLVDIQISPNNITQIEKRGYIDFDDLVYVSKQTYNQCKIHS